MLKPNTRRPNTRRVGKTARRFAQTSVQTGRPRQVHSVTLIDPLNGGHHLGYAVQLARELNARGIKVNVIGQPQFVEQVCQQAPIHRSHHLSLFSGDQDAYFAKGLLHVERTSLNFMRRAIQLSRAFESDITHFLFLDSFMLSLLAAKLSTRGTNVYATLHWAYFLSPFQHGQLGRLKGRLQLLNLRWLLGRGLRLMVHSAELAQTLRRLTGSQHVDYVPYPVEVPPLGDVRLPGLQLRERLGLAPSDKLLLAFGTVRHDKGVDLAIEALGALPGQYHLLVAGPPATFGAEDIARFAAQHAVGARVHTELGFIPDAEVGAYFAASDVVLIPYRKSFAGQSGPLTIAAALGLPLAVADVGILRETVGAYQLGELFEAEDVRSMARAIETAASKGAGAPNQRFLHDHAPERFAEAVLASYAGEAVAT